MKLIKTNEIVIKKSRFIAYYYEVNSKDEVIEIWNSLKAEHKNAKHIPYAYILSNTAGKSDDKEPSGTSANPIFNILERNKLINKAIFVVRYFGGTKLGASGLTRAYASVSSEVIKNSWLLSFYLLELYTNYLWKEKKHG